MPTVRVYNRGTGQFHVVSGSQAYIQQQTALIGRQSQAARESQAAQRSASREAAVQAGVQANVASGQRSNNFGEALQSSSVSTPVSSPAPKTPVFSGGAAQARAIQLSGVDPRAVQNVQVSGQNNANFVVTYNKSVQDQINKQEKQTGSSKTVSAIKARTTQVSQPKALSASSDFSVPAYKRKSVVEETVSRYPTQQVESFRKKEIEPRLAKTSPFFSKVMTTTEDIGERLLYKPLSFFLKPASKKIPVIKQAAESKVSLPFSEKPASIKETYKGLTRFTGRGITYFNPAGVASEVFAEPTLESKVQTAAIFVGGGKVLDSVLGGIGKSAEKVFGKTSTKETPVIISDSKLFVKSVVRDTGTESQLFGSAKIKSGGKTEPFIFKGKAITTNTSIGEKLFEPIERKVAVRASITEVNPFVQGTQEAAEIAKQELGLKTTRTIGKIKTGKKPFQPFGETQVGQTTDTGLIFTKLEKQKTITLAEKQKAFSAFYSETKAPKKNIFQEGTTDVFDRSYFLSQEGNKFFGKIKFNAKSSVTQNTNKKLAFSIPESKVFFSGIIEEPKAFTPITRKAGQTLLKENESKTLIENLTAAENQYNKSLSKAAQKISETPVIAPKTSTTGFIAATSTATKKNAPIYFSGTQTKTQPTTIKSVFSSPISTQTKTYYEPNIVFPALDTKLKLNQEFIPITTQKKVIDSRFEIKSIAIKDIGVESKIKSAFDFKQEQGTDLKLNLDNAFSSKTGLKVDSVFKTGLATGLISSQKKSFKNLSDTKSLLAYKTLTKLDTKPLVSSKTLPKNLFRIAPKIELKKKPIVPIPLFFGGKRKFTPQIFNKKSSFNQAFNVYVKSQGKIKLIGRKLSEVSALGVGVKETAGTSKRTFFIKPTQGKARSINLGFDVYSKLSKEYRKPIQGGKLLTGSLKFIEKSKYAINTPQEFKEITLKGIQANKLKNLNKKLNKKIGLPKTKNRRFF